METRRPRILNDNDRAKIEAFKKADAKEASSPNPDIIKTAAKDWVGTISLLTGIAALATTFGLVINLNALNDDPLFHISDWAITLQVLGEIAALVALISAAVAIMFGAIAAQGWPKRFVVDDPLQVAANRATVGQRSETFLTRSRISAGVAMIALLGVLLLSLWGERHEVKYLFTATAATPADSTVTCGNLQTDVSTGQLYLIPETTPESEATMVVSDYAKLTKLESSKCP